jgi:hypothetical protein
MPLSPNDWEVHARSTRDLADRMLVRGDTTGAEAMLKAAVELEKRLNSIITIASISAIGKDAVVGFDELQSSRRSAPHPSATAINERTDKGANDGTGYINDLQGLTCVHERDVVETLWSAVR